MKLQSLRRLLIYGSALSVPLVFLCSLGTTLGAWVGVLSDEFHVGLVYFQALTASIAIFGYVAIAVWAAFNIEASGRLTSDRVVGFLKFGIGAQLASILLSYIEILLVIRTFGDEPYTIIPAISHAISMTAWSVPVILICFFAIHQTRQKTLGDGFNKALNLEPAS